MIHLTHLIREHLVYEGLIHSVSRSRFIDMFENWVVSHNKFNILPPKNTSNKIVLQTYKNINRGELKNLLGLLNNLGWFISSCMVNTTEQDNSMINVKWMKFDENDVIKYIEKNEIIYAFQCEPKYDMDISDTDLKTAYHITLSINDLKIQKIGLIPKSLQKVSYHPERIYFALNIKDLEFLADRFYALDKSDSEFSIYEVDIDNAKTRNDQLRIFKDPNFENSIYTLSNIHPSNIKFIKKYQAN